MATTTNPKCRALPPVCIHTRLGMCACIHMRSCLHVCVCVCTIVCQYVYGLDTEESVENPGLLFVPSRQLQNFVNNKACAGRGGPPPAPAGAGGVALRACVLARAA